MSTGLEFSTAAEQAASDDGEIQPVVYTIDDRKITVHGPNEGQFAMLMASIGRGSNEGEAIGGSINFFIGLLGPEDVHYIERRLMDRTDPFSKKGATYIQDILENLTEAWSGRPTKPFSVSTRSPENDGQNSTPPTPLLTS